MPPSHCPRSRSGEGGAAPRSRHRADAAPAGIAQGRHQSVDEEEAVVLQPGLARLRSRFASIGARWWRASLVSKITMSKSSCRERDCERVRDLEPHRHPSASFASAAARLRRLDALGREVEAENARESPSLRPFELAPAGTAADGEGRNRRADEIPVGQVLEMRDSLVAGCQPVAAAHDRRDIPRVDRWLLNVRPGLCNAFPRRCKPPEGTMRDGEIFEVDAITKHQTPCTSAAERQGARGR